MMNNYYSPPQLMSFPYHSQFPFPTSMGQEEPISKAPEKLKNDHKKVSAVSNLPLVEPKINVGLTKRKLIGRLSYEERLKRIEKYRAKRTTRVWVKKISYNCRKRVADQRPRVKGRFIPKSELAEAKKAESAKIKNAASPENAKNGDSLPATNAMPQTMIPTINLTNPTPLQPLQTICTKEEKDKKTPKDVFCVHKNCGKDALWESQI